MSADVQPPPQPKYTRYSSVRKAAVSKPPNPPTAAKDAESQNDSIRRSMSRYRRPRVTSPPGHGVTTGVPSLPPMPQYLPPIQSSPRGSDATTHKSSQEQRPIRPMAVAAEETQPGGERMETLKEGSWAREQSGWRISGNETVQGTQERSRQQNIEHRKQDIPLHVEEDGVARLLAEQKRKDLERLEVELAAATARESSPGKPSPITDIFGVEKLGIFSRKRAKSKVSSAKSPTSSAKSPTSGAAGSDTSMETGSQEPAKVKSSEVPRAILQGGGGVVPGIDAPQSAVNAGERRVLIRCKQSSINLPVNPETTPVDIIFSAANILSQPVTPSATILLESYTQLGLERRIRCYEHIRDIMNSWDRDTQNALILQASESPNHDFDLDSSAVPRKQPGDVTVYMCHSQKAGKWSKRYITLLSTGQIFISKKQGAKVTDKDIVTICHLTDFDIYIPTTQYLRKTLRPPKKYCYAVKSQQKTSMFLSTENYVHFFSTDDYDIALKWYDACQQWRSWYLVNMMGEGQRKAPLKKQIVQVSDTRMRSGGNVIPSHKIKISVDESPYTIGSFKPLLDLNRFDSKQPDPEEEEEEDRPRQIPFHLRNTFPTADPPPQLRRDRDRHPPPTGGDPTFAPTGLLGRTYSQRQRLQKERELANDPSQGPFIPGPSLLNSATTDMTSTHPKIGIDTSRDRQHFLLGAPHRRSPSKSMSRPETSVGALSSPQHRSLTKRDRDKETKPLVDLTPRFIEAPQWSKEGKGHGVVPPSGVPLVEAATGPSPEMGGDGVGVLFRRDAAPGGSGNANANVNVNMNTNTNTNTRAFVKGGLLDKV